MDDTGGNPLAMLEIAQRLTDAQRVGAAPLPEAPAVGDRLHHLYGERLGELSAPARRAVLLTALNRSGSSSTVAAALTREELDVATALDEATDLGILVRSGGELGFRHPLLRSAALSQASAAEQRSAHRTLAAVLAADPDSIAGTWHRAEAVVGPDQPLALDLVRLAGHTRSRQGYASASVAMERAAQLSDDPVRIADWLAIAAADAFAAGDTGRTRALAARVLNAPGDDRALGLAQFTLGMLEEYAGSVPASVELLASAAARLDGAERTEALAELALARFRLNDIAGVIDCADGDRCGRRHRRSTPADAGGLHPGVRRRGRRRSGHRGCAAEAHRRADRRSLAARRSAIPRPPGAGRGFPRRPGAWSCRWASTS